MLLEHTPKKGKSRANPSHQANEEKSAKKVIGERIELSARPTGPMRVVFALPALYCCERGASKAGSPHRHHVKAS
jgi:hypothetical protein